MSIQYDRLREDLGLTSAVDDTYLDTVYVRVAEKYSDEASQENYARVIVLQSMIAQAAKRPDYIANETNISMKQIFDNLKFLLGYYTDLLQDGEDPDSSAARFGPMRATKRYKEYPENHRLGRRRFF